LRYPSSATAPHSCGGGRSAGVGRVKPVSAFRDAQGRVCRSVVYTLALGAYQREIAGVACREQDGSWSLAG